MPCILYIADVADRLADGNVNDLIIFIQLWEKLARRDFYELVYLILLKAKCLLKFLTLNEYLATFCQNGSVLGVLDDFFESSALSWLLNLADPLVLTFCRAVSIFETPDTFIS